MHADISRRTFDPADGYRSVLLQQGRVLLDADWNEQTEITAHHDEVRTLDLIGRSGGPAPDPGASGVDARGPFAIVGPGGIIPGDETAPVHWADLQVTPGRYYVDGVLAESPPYGETGGPPNAIGWQLTDQPHLPAIVSGEGTSPGLAEPDAATGDRYALELHVWTHHVTPDEDPALLEPALGGPDTTTRGRTVWQVRLSERLTSTGGPAPQCSDLHAAATEASPPLRMEAMLDEAGPSEDPCEITASGGYQRLENQLYRVQIHQGTSDPSGGTFLWSRENGTVTAGISELVAGGTNSHSTLTLDRLGRDEELSFGAGQLVEVTSTDRQLRGDPGYLGVTGAPVLVADTGGSASALDLPVTWLDDGPPDLESLGRVPIARRWEGGPLGLIPDGGNAGDPISLEGGISVAFPAGGAAATGDYWLVAARTVRMAYGLTQLSGTIEWPPGGRGPLEQPPVGPRRHRAPLAILRRQGDGWVLDSDCRLLVPASSELVTIDLIGGDGQEALPGAPLPEPVRVAVRNGGLPVAGAKLLADPGTGSVGGLSVTRNDGTAAFTWTLDEDGPTTQTLTISRLDDHDDPIDVPIVVTGRLSVASQVAWTPPNNCPDLAASDTVQDALSRLAMTTDLRLLGGDGQEVAAEGRVVPQPVRVVVDSPCGPRSGIEVTALAESRGDPSGLVAEAEEGKARPDNLVGAATERAVVRTDANGVAAFWWQPGFGPDRSATLDIFIDKASEPPVRVSAQLDPGEVRSGGVHITSVDWQSGRPFLNNSMVEPADLISGVKVALDSAVLPASVRGKPVVRMALELPWPIGPEREPWDVVDPVGFRHVTLRGVADSNGADLTWKPDDAVADWVGGPLLDALARVDWTEPLLGWFTIAGWAIVADEAQRGHINGHADAVLVGGRTDLLLPTDDQVTGGTFTQWFRLTKEDSQSFVQVPDVYGRTEAVAVRTIEAEGLKISAVEQESSEFVRAKLVSRTDPPPGTQLEPGASVRLIMSTGRG